LWAEYWDPCKTEPGFVLSVPRRQMHGGAWREIGARTNLILRNAAHAMRHGAPG
jgi:hypothetical protein